MSFLLGFGQSLLSGLSSIASGLFSAISSVSSDLNNAYANVTNFFQQLPSNVQSFFQTIGGALVAFGHTFGAYILSGLQWIGNAISSAMVPIERGLETLGSTILNALNTLWNDIKAFASNIYNTTVSTISGVIGVVQDVINGIKNTAVNVYNFLANVVNDVYNVFTYVFNAFFNLPQFFSQTAEFFNRLFSGGEGGYNLLNVVPNIVAGEASRVASALSDVVAYNAFMEMMPKMIYGIANSPFFGNGIQGAFSKAILMMASPILSAFVAMFTKSFMDNLFTPTRTTQTVSRPSSPQLQPFTATPSAQLPQRSVPTTDISDVEQMQTSGLTATQIELEIERPNVTGVFVEDVIGIGTPGGGTAQIVSGFINFQNAIQKFEDSFEIVPGFFMKLMSSLQSEFGQNMTVNIALTILENIYQATATVGVLASVDAVSVVLPYGISFCNPGIVPQPGEYYSVMSNQATVDASVTIVEEMCIPPYNLLSDSISVAYGIGNTLQTNIVDAISASVNVTDGIPFPQTLSDYVTASMSIQAVLPSNQTITYYIPIGVSITYSIEVQQITYSGQLSYSVSGS